MEYKEHNVHVSTETIVKTIIIVLLFGTLFILKTLILVVLMSIVIASAIEPAVQWLTKRRIPRLPSVIMIYLFLAAVLAGVVYFLLLPLLSESTSFLKNFPIYFSESNLSNTIAHSSFLSSQPFVETLKESVNLNQFVDQINGIIGSLTSNTFNTIATVFGGISSFLLMILLSFYLTVSEDGIEKFLRVITTIKHEKYAISLWKRTQRKIGLWMQGQLILAIIIGMLVYLGLTLIGVENALLLAFLAAAFEIIPLFGPILAAIPAIAIASVGGGFSMALIVAGFYIIVHQFENQLIYPLVVKKIVGVSPIISIIALVAGWELGGFLGLILSVPVSTALIEFFDDLERNKIEKIEKMQTE
ncbi:MAG: AI-2E family transporter [Patescibacteria group bacterium]